MLTRQQDIVKLAQLRGEITIRELSELFQVSEMTIHRDLELLQREGYLYKKRGAAVYIDQADRLTTQFYTDEKRRIGKKAAEWIRPGQTVLFDNSTTACACARFLDRVKPLTFYTTNMETARILAGYAGTTLYCSGGYYFPESRGFVGTQAEEFVRRTQADVCIIGASGVSAEFGITNPYPMHSSLQRQIIASAQYRILVCDHSKFDRVAAEKAAELSQIDLIVTDSGIREDIYQKYSALTQIIIA